jgi:hypothetical protein
MKRAEMLKLGRDQTLVSTVSLAVEPALLACAPPPPPPLPIVDHFRLRDLCLPHHIAHCLKKMI